MKRGRSAVTSSEGFVIHQMDRLDFKRLHEALGLGIVIGTNSIGTQTIYGFLPASDVIEINHNLIANFGALKKEWAQVGSDTVITIDANDAITLKGVLLSTLHGHDFAFV
jgi:hypothetical protein